MRVSYIRTFVCAVWLHADSMSIHYMNNRQQLSLQPLYNQLNTQIKRRHAFLILIVAAGARCYKPMYVCHIMSCHVLVYFIVVFVVLVSFMINFWQDVDVQHELLLLQLVERNEMNWILFYVHIIESMSRMMWILFGSKSKYKMKGKLRMQLWVRAQWTDYRQIRTLNDIRENISVIYLRPLTQ